MDANAYNIIVDALSHTLVSKDLMPTDTETGSYFSNNERAVRVDFNDSKNLFELQQCDTVDGKPSGDWKVLSSWLFLPEHTEKDARMIATDFDDTLREALGIKIRKTRSAEMTMAATAPGENPNLEAFAQRFITVFPQYKDSYKEYVDKYDVCLYIDFFEKYGVECLQDLLRKNDKKRLVKLVGMLDEMYVSGDSEVTAVVICVVIVGAIKDEPQLYETFNKYIEENTNLQFAIQNALKVAK